MKGPPAIFLMDSGRTVSILPCPPAMSSIACLDAIELQIVVTAAWIEFCHWSPVTKREENLLFPGRIPSSQETFTLCSWTLGSLSKNRQSLLFVICYNHMYPQALQITFVREFEKKLKRLFENRENIIPKHFNRAILH